MKYRDHRESLIDSLKTTQEINTMDQLKLHISNSALGNKVEDVKIEYYGYDDRIPQDVYIVSAKFEGSDQYYAVGYSDGPLHD